MKEIIPTIYGMVTDDGKFHPDDPETFKNAFLSLRNKIVEVVVKEKKNKRSTGQNAYMWGVVYKMISEHTGYSTEQVHHLCKQIFNSEIVIIGGMEYRIEKSTTKLSTMEFSDDYIFAIQQWAAQELGLVIPDPNETNY